MSENSDVKGKVVSLLTEAMRGGKSPQARKRRAPSQQVTGNNNIQAGGDVHIRTERLLTRPRVTVVPGYGVVSEEQKARLIELCNQWVATNSAVRRSKLSYAAARGALNRQARVTSYHLIAAERFVELERWLLNQIARINAMPSAAARSPEWRASRITAIQARCTEKGLQDWRHTYMLEHFRANSMTELSDGDLQHLYRAVFAR